MRLFSIRYSANCDEIGGRFLIIYSGGERHRSSTQRPQTKRDTRPVHDKQLNEMTALRVVASLRHLCTSETLSWGRYLSVKKRVISRAGVKRKTIIERNKFADFTAP